MNKEAQSTMISGSGPIEQLWYTWSDKGIDTLRVGFRIRAASPGLSDPRSELVQRLDRYQRYSLPKGADDTTSLGIAPVCLTLIDTEKERILVHKVYTGRDGVGRYGAFFVHLLAKLPTEFSPTDAISLWRSPFWHTSDDVGEPYRKSTQLETVSLDYLRQQKTRGPLHQSLNRTIQVCLPYIIEAYLLKTLLSEDNEGEKSGQPTPQTIYIAAPDDVAADLISGLIRSLPPQLVEHLTFSTYERDTSEATTEIISTCWLSGLGQEKNPAVEQLLPAHYYQEKLAINCYTGECSQLEKHPLVRNHPLAAQCAQDAAEYFLTGSPHEFQDLLDNVKTEPDLTVGMFLDQYASDVARAQTPSQKDVEEALTPRSPFDYERSAKRLDRQGYQDKILALIVSETGWWMKYHDAVINLHNYSFKLSSLAKALRKISERAYLVVVGVTQKEVTRLEKKVPSEKTIPDVATTFKLMVELMECTTPPTTKPDIWRSLLQDLRAIQHVLTFFYQYWDTYVQIMKIWSIALPPSQDNNTQIAPLLVIPWSRFGRFLTLHLPLDWTEMATKVLVYESPQPTSEVVYNLEQSYHIEVKGHLQRLVQEQQHWTTATSLFEKLIKGKYEAKIQLLFLLLDSPMGGNETMVKSLLQRTQLTLFEQASFLEQYGPRYLPNEKIKKTIMNMFKVLASSNLQQEKMSVLLGWLASHQLATWLEMSPDGEKNLSSILSTALPMSLEQIGEFFNQCGNKYIPLYPGSKMLDLFEIYAQSRGGLRVRILYIWLDCHLKLEILERVLGSARLDTDERRTVLLTYGPRYLALYPRSHSFLEYVQEFLNYLSTANLALFRSTTSPLDPSAAESLLWFLYNRPSLSPEADLAHNWYNVAQFVRNPAILTNEWQFIVRSINWLLTSGIAQEPMSTSLMQELALACLIDEQQLVDRVHTISSILSPQNIVQLLYSIAKCAHDGIQQRHFEKTLFEPCILLAFRSKTLIKDEAAQEIFVKGFLDILLRDAGQKTLKELSKSARGWSSRSFQAEWQNYQSYVSQRMISPDTPPSILRRIRNYGSSLFMLSNPSIQNQLSASEGTPTPPSVSNPIEGPTVVLKPIRASEPTQVGKQRRRVSIILVVAALIAALLFATFLVYVVQASAQVTLTVTAQNYTQSMALMARTDRQQGSLLAHQITKDFPKKGTGHATGTKVVDNIKSRGFVCFVNAGDTAVEIPLDTIISTKANVQFSTTAAAVYTPHSTCTSNPVPVPIQAVQSGRDGNIAANTITVIPPDSLNTIAQQNNTTENGLKLTVSNAEATNGGGAQPEPAITSSDLDNAKSDLSNQLKADITNWVHGLSINAVTGQPATAATLINTQSKDTALDRGNTFSAEVDVKVTILVVNKADLQKVVLSRLNTMLSQDQLYSGYVIAENVKLPVAISHTTIQDNDGKSMQLKFSASALAIPLIDKATVQDLVASKSPATARQLIMDKFQSVERADIQVTPNFLPWFISPWPGRIGVTVLPGTIMNDLQAKK